MNEYWEMILAVIEFNILDEEVEEFKSRWSLTWSKKASNIVYCL